MRNNGMYEDRNGTRLWLDEQGNLPHCEDGPAIEYANGICRWFLNGIEYTEEEYNIEMRLRKWGMSVDNRV